MQLCNNESKKRSCRCASSQATDKEVFARSVSVFIKECASTKSADIIIYNNVTQKGRCKPIPDSRQDRRTNEQKGILLICSNCITRVQHLPVSKLFRTHTVFKRMHGIQSFVYIRSNGSPSHGEERMKWQSCTLMLTKLGKTVKSVYGLRKNTSKKVLKSTTGRGEVQGWLDG